MSLIDEEKLHALVSRLHSQVRLSDDSVKLIAQMLTTFIVEYGEGDDGKVHGCTHIDHSST
jgi:hypothetical protein